MIQEEDARAAVEVHLGSGDFELEEFPEGWLVIRPVAPGIVGTPSLAVERSTGTLLMFPSAIPPRRVTEEFAAVRPRSHAVGQAGAAAD